MDTRPAQMSSERFGEKETQRRRREFPLWIRRLAYALIVGICLYRISIFRPLPLDDTTGALRPLLYRWFLSYSGLFNSPANAHVAWTELCLTGLMALALLAAINYLWRENLVRLPVRAGQMLSSPLLFWTLLACTLVFCRLPSLLGGELNPDESEFLVSAGKLFYDPSFFRSVNTGTSGPLNIYPLMWPAIFGLSPDFASSRLLGLVVIFLSVFVLYRALTLVGNERIARLAILPVAGTFALFRQGELVHNSSEHIPFLVVSFAIYQGAKLIMDATRGVPTSFFWMGFLVSAAYLTKMQAVPIVVGIGAVTLAYVFSTAYGRRVWDSAGWGLVGFLIPITCVVTLAVQGGAFRILWRDYVRGNMIYANGVNAEASLRKFAEYVTLLPEVRIYLLTVFAIAVAYLIGKMRRSMSTAHTLFIELLVVSVAVSASAFLPSVERSNLYAYLAVLCICATPVYFLVLFRNPSSRQDPVKWFGLLAAVSVCAAVFSIHKPHRYFIHYLLFLYIPLGAFVGYLFIRASGGADDRLPDPGLNSKFRWMRFAEGRLAFLSAAFVLSLGCEAYLWDFKLPADLEIPPILRAPEGYLIRHLTNPGDQIFVWGWNLHPYLSSGRVPSARDPNTMGLYYPYVGVPTSVSDALTESYRARLLKEFQSNPPALIVDAVGPTSWFTKDPQVWGFELIPSFKAFIDQHYIHLIDLYGERYFLRRDVAAKREREFSAPVPTLACSPAAIRCSNRAITLPAELPPTRMPGRMRIDVEFMPIHNQLGPATVFNTEKTASSFQGFRLEHIQSSADATNRAGSDDRYHLLIGVGGEWVRSKEFSAPQGRVALVSIEMNGTTVTLKKNDVLLDEIHLPRPVADAGGPVNVGSWIGGIDPFSGKVQFFQIVDLDKEKRAVPGNRSAN